MGLLLYEDASLSDGARCVVINHRTCPSAHHLLNVPLYLFVVNLITLFEKLKDYMASNKRVVSERYRNSERRKEAVVASFKAQSRHLPGGTDENYEKPRSE
jgi:hypothetical protein